ncbi:MAG: hypothetical protein K2M55_00025 [Muribaculaceae bacterium]|nr:hypothetical protein [Muribaculaceae bacterium]
MKKLYFTYALAAAMVAGGAADATALPIQEEKPLEMYALGAGGTTGVYRLNLTDLTGATRLNSTAYDQNQYTGSSFGGGGTFLSPEKVVGVKYNYGAYPFEATAENAWVPSYFNSSYYINKVYDMAYDQQADIIYCWYAYTDYVKTLGIYNPTTHEVARVGNAANTNVYGLAIDAEGQLWGVGDYGYVYKINKTTGVATELTGSMGCGVQFSASMPMSAAIDPASGLMYVVARASAYDYNSSLVKVDLSTYKAENLGAMSGYYNCLYINGSTIVTGAPAPVENLTATFDGTNTVVTFTAPTENAGGDALSGTLTYTVNVDGEEAATGTVAAGEEVSLNLTPADGLHEITVKVANDEGESKEAKTTVFSGYDQPGNISGLTADAEGNTVTLTWTAPTGVNGGMIDTSKLSYLVSCDGEVVAEGLTDTTFETTVEGNYHQFTFAVTVKYGEEEGQSQSVNVMAGDAYTIPYALDLASVTDLGQAGLTILDPNLQNSRETEKWKLGSSNDEKYLEAYKQAYWYQSDFAYLPPMALKAGVEYTLTFQSRAVTDAWGTYKANLQVVIAKKPTTTSGEYTSLESYEMVPSRTDFSWADNTVKISVEENGTYSLAFLAWDQTDLYGNYSVEVKDIVITQEIVTPQPATDLTVTTQADNNRNVDITFVLPTESTTGKELAAISKVEILRGTEVIETIDTDLAPGNTVSYTDEDAPRGIHSYSVIVYCDDETSTPVAASVIVGYLNNLSVTALSWPTGEIHPDETGEFVVEVTNDGFEKVLEGAYEVVLLCDGEQVDAQLGQALDIDASATYTFELKWNGIEKAYAEYVAKVVFDGDEDLADNETEPVTVNFKQTDGVDNTFAATTEVSAAAGVITVKATAGAAVAVVAVDGRTVAAGICDGEFKTAALAPGVYVVTVDAKSVKVAL